MRWSLHCELIASDGSVSKTIRLAITFPVILVPITPKYLVRLNQSLHLFETHCAFLNWVETFYCVVKVAKSSHHLSHERASKGMGLFLVWCHRLICIALSLCKHACKEVCDVKQGIDPSFPLTCSVVQQMMARYRNFLQPVKDQYLG